MKKEELSYLKSKKVSYGYDEDCAKGEVRQFLDTQKGYKLLKREFRKQQTVIRNLLTKLSEQKNIISKLRERKKKKVEPTIKKKRIYLGKEILSKDILKAELKKHKVFIGRLKNNMEDKEYTKTMFIKELMMPGNRLDFCLDYLVKDGFLGSKIKNGTRVYWKK